MITIGLQEETETIRLWVQDSGSGIPEEVDLEHPKTLGMELIRSLSEHQLGGRLQFKKGEGTKVEIQFPKKDG